jgi:hypothetical protein
VIFASGLQLFAGQSGEDEKREREKRTDITAKLLESTLSMLGKANFQDVSQTDIPATKRA